VILIIYICRNVCTILCNFVYCLFLHKNAFFFAENGVESGAQPTIVRAPRDRRKFNQNVCFCFYPLCYSFSAHVFIYSRR